MKREEGHKYRPGSNTKQTQAVKAGLSRPNRIHRGDQRPGDRPLSLPYGAMAIGASAPLPRLGKIGVCSNIYPLLLE